MNGQVDRQETRHRAPRSELYLQAFFGFTWILAFLVFFRIVRTAGLLNVGLYPLYSMASAFGWISGNIFMHRRRATQDAAARLRLLILYLTGPLSLLYLLRALAPQAVQAGAPFVPIYSFGVYAIFFMVPVTLPRTPPRRPRIR